jgi:hypothetical protein
MDQPRNAARDCARTLIQSSNWGARKSATQRALTLVLAKFLVSGLTDLRFVFVGSHPHTSFKIN